MKRRLLSVLLCMAMVASLTACGGEKNTTSSASMGEGTEKTEGGSAEASGKENSEAVDALSGKKLPGSLELPIMIKILSARLQKSPV